MARFPVAFRPPAFASRVILRPLGSSAFLTVGLPDAHRHRDPIGIVTFHMHKQRPGLGAPLDPGTAVLTRPALASSVGACRFTAASPATPLEQSIGEANDDEASTRVHLHSPARSFPCL